MSSRLVRCVVAASLLLVPVLVSEAGSAQSSGSEPKLAESDAPVEVTETVTGDKAATSRLAETDAALLARNDATQVPVMIKLDYDSIATYSGGVKGLAPTSPSVTGRALSGAAAEQQYEAYVAGVEAQAVAGLSTIPGFQATRSFRVVYGGIAAMMPANAVEAALAVDGVVAVQADEMNQLLTDSSPDFLGAPTIYSALGGSSTAGAGVIYGNLDSGVWPEHPSFADLGNLSAPPGPARECNYGDNPLTPAADVFVCQNKLIGGAHFTDTYDVIEGDDPFPGTAHDSDGHGTHTASTAGGNVLASAPVFGQDLGPIQGLAPGAWVMEYKVCGPLGCYPSDSTAAVEQAVLDGVDVINFSISGGTDPFSDPVELAFLDAYAAGVFVSASAGNEGPGAGTVNHLSPWVTTVGASTQTREFGTTLDLAASGGDTLSIDGISITAGIASPLPVALAASVPGYTDPLCNTPAAPGTFTGMIVACQRSPGRIMKGFNVMNGGAAGMILYNLTLADALSDSHWLPAVHLADGTSFLAFMGSHTGVTGSWAAGAKRDGQGDVMASFSSRGPGGNFIKPDITAPGVQILAGDTPASFDPSLGPPGELYQAIAGTSMSSPHIAGSGILLRALHPTWTPGQIHSAIMTTATTDVVEHDTVTPAGPFSMGSGRVDLNVAGSAALTFDESATDYVAMANDPINAVHLNVPSINAPVMPGMLTTTRVATNTSGMTQNFTTSATTDVGTIKVSPKNFSLAPGASRTLTIEISAPVADGLQHFGQVQITPSISSPLHLPVAFIPTQGDVTLTQNCTPSTIFLGGATQCTVTAHNDSFTDSATTLETRVSNELTVTGAVDATVVDPHRVQASTTLGGVQAGVPSVAPGTVAGYLPLDAFGVTPIPIGDEDIINFSVPAYVFAGETFATIGVDSNGYLVAGGGTSEDNNCCNIPNGPDPGRPNNVLAPFWTDLDGTGAAGIFAATLTDGVNTWIVVEWRVNIFGTADLQVFQTWLGIDGTEDITYAYDPGNLPTNGGQDFLVGAENAVGDGDMDEVLPTQDLRVTSSAPTPGGTYTYTVFLEGAKRGKGKVTTNMNTATVAGTTVVQSGVKVK